jgi:hypothetical protein
LAIHGKDFSVKCDTDIQMIVAENVRINLETYSFVAVPTNGKNVPELKASNSNFTVTSA